MYGKGSRVRMKSGKKVFFPDQRPAPLIFMTVMAFHRFFSIFLDFAQFLYVDCRFISHNSHYLASDFIQSAIFLASSLGTCGIGGIGVE